MVDIVDIVDMTDEMQHIKLGQDAVPMKRKRLTRDAWGFEGFPYRQVRVDMPGFGGLVCLIDGLTGQNQYWKLPIAGQVPVCGDGMTWLQLIPDGQSHVLTAKYYHGKVGIWYADMIECVDYDPDGVAVFVDKYLDVIFTPQGDLHIDDRDELDAALAAGSITQAQYDGALRECDVVLDAYCRDVAQTERLCDAVLACALHSTI